MVIICINVCLWLDVKENPPHFKNWSPWRDIMLGNQEMNKVFTIHFLLPMMWVWRVREFNMVANTTSTTLVLLFSVSLRIFICVVCHHAINTSWQTIQTTQAYIEIWWLNYMYNYIHNDIKFHLFIYIILDITFGYTKVVITINIVINCHWQCTCVSFKVKLIFFI